MTTDPREPRLIADQDAARTREVAAANRRLRVQFDAVRAAVREHVEPGSRAELAFAAILGEPR